VLEGEAASAPLGSTVTITLLTKQTSGNQSVLVPVGAVYDRGSGPGVWVVDDKSEVKFRPVQIDSIGQEEVVVSHGVEAGEKVVALGAHLLHEGQVVNRQKRSPMRSFNLSALAVRERAITLFFIFASACAGIYAYFHLGRAEDPSFTIKVLTVTTVVARSNRPGNAGSRGLSRWRRDSGVALV
jgi:hypothetical protein